MLALDIYANARQVGMENKYTPNAEWAVQASYAGIIPVIKSHNIASLVDTLGEGEEAKKKFFRKMQCVPTFDNCIVDLGERELIDDTEGICEPPDRTWECVYISEMNKSAHREQLSLIGYDNVGHMFYCLVFMCFKNSSDITSIIAPVGVYMIFGKDGKHLADGADWLYDYNIADSKDADCAKHEIEKETAFSCGLALATFAMLHCKNVHLSEPIEADEKLNRKRIKRGKRPKVVYRDLLIDGKPIMHCGGTHDPHEGGMREHIVRGHFKTFTKDKPLFGTQVGTWFWHSQMRGSKDVGQVKKQYVVGDNGK